eukprot:TRINITY_DN2915_c0_g1_i1.p1 TRINITY_DN2915_c0_g1~~TRINITY_DN2915_c0_g1_i1.p1  ORF type:complete len:135 (+),score=18.69 TRINITY_DN2915_c0_g1_i1:35-406(+)
MSNYNDIDEREYIIDGQAYTKHSITKEFFSLPYYFPGYDIDPLARTYTNYCKNRYDDILPLGNSVYRLGQLNNDTDSIYINANVISEGVDYQEYITTQAPLPHTFGDFWRMVWESGFCLFEIA